MAASEVAFDSEVERRPLSSRLARVHRIHSLAYHDVLSADQEPHSGFPGRDAYHYKLDLAIFEDHLEAVTQATEAASAAHDMTILDLASQPRGDGAGLPPEVVFLHFDDGGRSALDVAPRLEAAGWRGHFHIATDWIGQPGFLSRDDIRALHRSGHVIGSHSASHPSRLSHCDRPTRELEWAQSVDILSDITGEQVVVGSVPGGFNSEGVTAAAAAAGIRYLFDSRPTSRIRSDRRCTVLGRYSVRRGTSPSRAAALASGKTTAQLAERLRWNVLKAAKRFGGGKWLDLRNKLLNERWGEHGG